MEDGNAITQIFLPLSLTFIMYSVGLELTLLDSKRVAVQPQDFLIGAVSQMFFLPWWRSLCCSSGGSIQPWPWA